MRHEMDVITWISDVVGWGGGLRATRGGETTGSERREIQYWGWCPSQQQEEEEEEEEVSVGWVLSLARKPVDVIGSDPHYSHKSGRYIAEQVEHVVQDNSDRDGKIEREQGRGGRGGNPC